MVQFLKNLLLAVSCFPLVVGCCWLDYPSHAVAGATSPQDGWQQELVDLPSGESNCTKGSHGQGTDPQGQGHSCFLGVAPTNSISCGMASCGVQICYSSVTCARTLVTPLVTGVVPASSLVGSIRLHLAKQVLLI